MASNGHSNEVNEIKEKVDRSSYGGPKENENSKKAGKSEEWRKWRNVQDLLTT